MNLTEGTVLGGRYTLTRKIAVGGMGEVWEATDGVLGRTVAVKLLHPGHTAQPEFAERFRGEARHTASLAHPNIAAVYDYGEDDGSAFLVMELVQGQPLSQVIAARAPMRPAEVASIVGQAASALQAAHDAGVVHRDVKPANIIVGFDGTAKLTDFGIARARDTVPITRTGQVMGTAQYLSPEQAMGQGATAASDVYALGVVAHEMLTGERPFDTGTAVATALAHVNTPPPELPASVPEPLRGLVMACLAKDPADRPASAGTIVRVLSGGRGLPDLPGAGMPSGRPGATVAMPADLGRTTVLPAANEAIGGDDGLPAGMPAGMQAGAPSATSSGAHSSQELAGGPAGTWSGAEPPDGEDGAGRRGRRWLAVLGVLLLLALVVLAVAFAQGAFSPHSPSKPSSPPSTSPSLSTSSAATHSTSHSPTTSGSQSSAPTRTTTSAPTSASTSAPTSVTSTTQPPTTTSPGTTAPPTTSAPVSPTATTPPAAESTTSPPTPSATVTGQAVGSGVPVGNGVPVRGSGHEWGPQ